MRQTVVWVAPAGSGMVTSNEPGFYADGKFGIRIESIIICKQAHTPHQFGGVRWVLGGWWVASQQPEA